MSFVLLALSIPAAALAWNSVITRPGRYGPVWLLALVTGELAPFHIVVRAAFGAGFAAAGWAGGWAGRTGLALLGLSIVLIAVNHARGLGTRRVVEKAAAEVLGEPVRLPRLRLGRLLRPFPSVPRGIEVARDLPYGPDHSHRLDLFLPAARGARGGDRRPVLLQVHGGGWTGGRRDQQARPLMHRMAAAGWVVASISYRLSPSATFPDPLVDVKRALAWVREHGPAHGAGPGFVAVTGGSAGGQLAALAALTAGRPEYQPGFEAADTSVQVCVPFYGVHDLLDRTGTRPKWPYLSRYVLKAEPSADPALWESASPTRSARADRPPFLILHGAADTLVRPGESRRLAAALRAAGGPPAGLAEVPGATHGFDVMHSLRAERAVDGVQAVLEALWARHRAEAEAD